MRRKLMEDQ
jgi:hypothetical protein